MRVATKQVAAVRPLRGRTQKLLRGFRAAAQGVALRVTQVGTGSVGRYRPVLAPGRWLGHVGVSDRSTGLRCTTDDPVAAWPTGHIMTTALDM